jgi:hypothetical protein
MLRFTRDFVVIASETGSRPRAQVEGRIGRRNRITGATVRSHDRKGFLRRALTAIGGMLLRGISGRAGSSYMRRFSGDDNYWEQAIAAQLGWPGEKSSGTQPDAVSVPAGGATSRDRADSPVAASRDAEPENEPVSTWTKRQLDDYSALNAGLAYAFESEPVLHENSKPTGSPGGPAAGSPRSGE